MKKAVMIIASILVMVATAQAADICELIECPDVITENTVKTDNGYSTTAIVSHPIVGTYAVTVTTTRNGNRTDDYVAYIWSENDRIMIGTLYRRWITKYTTEIECEIISVNSDVLYDTCTGTE